MADLDLRRLRNFLRRAKTTATLQAREEQAEAEMVREGSGDTKLKERDREEDGAGAGFRGEPTSQS